MPSNVTGRSILIEKELLRISVIPENRGCQDVEVVH